LQPQDLRDPVHGRHEPSDIAGVGFRDQEPQTVLIGMASPDEPFGLPDLGLLLGAPRVGVDDLGGEQGFEPRPRQPGNGWGDRCIDVHRRRTAQMPGRLGNLAGFLCLH